MEGQPSRMPCKAREVRSAEELSLLGDGAKGSTVVMFGLITCEDACSMA